MEIATSNISEGIDDEYTRNIAADGGNNLRREGVIMIMKESMRKRLQTLARAPHKENNIKVMPGLLSIDFSTIYLNDGAEIIPGLPCTRAAWVVTKASCAHESAHILFTCKT